MEKKQRNSIEADEITFFANYYEDQAYNPTGWRLRLRRELRSLLHQAGEYHLRRVLSIGCGDGQFELMMAPYAEHVTGLDICLKLSHWPSARQPMQELIMSNFAATRYPS